MGSRCQKGLSGAAWLVWVDLCLMSGLGIYYWAYSIPFICYEELGYAYECHSLAMLLCLLVLCDVFPKPIPVTFRIRLAIGSF